ncbi:ABC transporter permease [Nocardioides ginsengisoli]|uniref:ABC transporter permease n=1 Tax=Nocardioides ginsengisoli TaxID=363868 RepID=A0ABW3VVF3_9ACTN
MAADAAASLLLRPGHTIGMIAGITLGVAGVVGIVVIADTQQVQIDRQFDLQRSDRVVVRSFSPTQAGFDPQRVAAVEELEPVVDAGEFSIWSGAVTVSRTDGAARSSRPLLVVDAAGLRATDTRVVAGAPGDDLAAARGPVAWIGERLAQDLGVAPGSDLADTRVLVRGIPFEVAGIVANDDGFGYASSGVLVSRPTAVAVLGGAGENVRVIAHVRPGSASAVGDNMVAGLDPHRELTLEDVTPPDGKILLSKVGSDLRRIGAALGGFMGLVGMITVANTLMMAVYQRRRELGLRSAMGWKRRRIGVLVLTESATAGIVASILGVGLGLGVAAIWSHLQHWELILAPWLPLAAIGAGLTASLVGGLIPAYLAASTPPMTAMRS